MPVSIPNTTTVDTYVAALTFTGQTPVSSGYFVVANNPATVEYVYADRQGGERFSPEIYCPPGVYPITSGDRDYIIGIRFRSFVPGSAAQVFGALFYKGEPFLGASSAFTSLVSPGGGITPATTVTILAISRLTLGADVLPVANTDTTVLSLPVTMPAAGGPFRVLGSWSQMVLLGGGASVFQGWIDDQQAGNPAFAPAQSGIEVANLASGFAASSYSRNTYANGVTITFLLRFRINSIGNSVKFQPVAGTHGETFLELAVFSSV